MLGRYLDLGNPVAKHPLNDGLLAWWLGLPNNSGGARFFDVSGHGNHGTLTSFGFSGPTTGWIPTPNGFQGLGLDGTDDRVVLPSVAIGTAHTVEVVFRRRSGTAFALVGATGSSYPAYYSGGAFFYYASGSSGNSSGYTVVSGEWTHLVVARAGTELAWYANGVPIGTATMGSNNAATLNRLGSIDDSNNIAGDIAYCRVLNRGVSAGEAWASYDQWRRAWPDTLRRWSRKAWLMGGVASGGGGGNRRRRVILCGGR